MKIEKTFRRKVSKFADGMVFIIPKEVVEEMQLDKSYYAVWSKEKDYLKVEFRNKTEAKEIPKSVCREIIIMKTATMVVIPKHMTDELEITINHFIDIDGDIDKKELYIKKNGIDMMQLKEVERE